MVYILKALRFDEKAYLKDHTKFREDFPELLLKQLRSLNFNDLHSSWIPNILLILTDLFFSDRVKVVGELEKNNRKFEFEYRKLFNPVIAEKLSDQVWKYIMEGNNIDSLSYLTFHDLLAKTIVLK